MRYHHHRHLGTERAVWQQILGPKLFQRLVDQRQLVVAVEFAFAKAGKVLAASQDARCAQPGEELAPIGSRFAWVRRNRSRAHHLA